ncbi:methyltransferase domain-containing protein [Actinoalloteichus fjordicus]|uniref:Protein-L-isoaspartate O-methyltransferase n=1 Tax=Actinoalloteichus fjordicus TaxID=1612552 RepID=A0AAC9LJP5_9PSEU|nr:methyltransferase domain-containing protein [Actinoalloteichus fjordicus]APU17545.1 protein-L-isoaspartate carboxylmethyltransferase [Actinoalloteichus fjordicus]
MNTADDVDTESLAACLRSRFIASLIDAGAIPDPRWQDAFRAIPRHRFVARFTAYGTQTVFDIARSDQRRAALDACYSNETLLTQQDAGGTPTSSSTEVTLMALMLDRLDISPGHRVLEIGTGTGYNTALLCHALGDESVTSIDIHPELVDKAVPALAEAGHHPVVVCGDGAGGVPERAPFDRIIATCGVLRVPQAWQRQLAPHGAILVNVGLGLARLVLRSDGSVTGPFISEAAFMRLRHDVSAPAVTTREILSMTTTGQGDSRVTDLPAALADRSFQVIVCWVLPTVEWVTILDPRVHVFVEPGSGSWVRAGSTDAGRAEILEHGPRSLWRELLAVAELWEGAGRPEPTRFGLTVAADGSHTLWLDRPDELFCELD